MPLSLRKVQTRLANAKDAAACRRRLYHSTGIDLLPTELILRILGLILNRVFLLEVDDIGRVESQDLKDLSVGDAADLCGAGIHRVCIRPPTELVTFDELCCLKRSLGRSEEHVGRRE